jgi:RNA polymerase sigma-70 factor, ECF subfamily
VPKQTIQMETNLQKLAQQIRAGNEKAFAELFDVYYKPLTFYSLRIVKSLAVAEELVQDLFCRLWEKREEIIIEQSFKAYLYGAVRLNSLHYLRDNKLHNRKLESIGWERSDFDSTNDKLAEADIYDILEKTLANLPERSSEIFTLNRIDGLKYREIAAKLSLSEKTVEAHISQVLKLLRKNLRDFIGFLPWLLFFICK